MNSQNNTILWIWIFLVIVYTVSIFVIMSEVLIDNLENPDCTTKAGYDLDNPDDSTGYAKYCLDGYLVLQTQITIVMLSFLPILIITLLRLTVWKGIKYP